MAQKKTFQVVGEQTMHCGGCERTVSFTLSNLPDVKVIKVDHKTQLIEVLLSGDEAGLEKVKKELDWIGYEVELV